MEYKVGQKVRRKITERYEKPQDEEYWTRTILEVLGEGAYVVENKETAPEFKGKVWTWHSNFFEKALTKLDKVLK